MPLLLGRSTSPTTWTTPPPRPRRCPTSPRRRARRRERADGAVRRARRRRRAVAGPRLDAHPLGTTASTAGRRAHAARRYSALCVCSATRRTGGRWALVPSRRLVGAAAWRAKRARAARLQRRPRRQPAARAHADGGRRRLRRRRRAPALPRRRSPFSLAAGPPRGMVQPRAAPAPWRLLRGRRRARAAHARCRCCGQLLAVHWTPPSTAVAPRQAANGDGRECWSQGRAASAAARRWCCCFDARGAAPRDAQWLSASAGDFRAWLQAKLLLAAAATWPHPSARPLTRCVLLPATVGALLVAALTARRCAAVGQPHALRPLAVCLLAVHLAGAFAGAAPVGLPPPPPPPPPSPQAACCAAAAPPTPRTKRATTVCATTTRGRRDGRPTEDRSR